MHSLSDPELVKKIKNSDQDAFKILYDRYSEMLFYFLWSRTGNKEEANDLVQEVFVKIWRIREKLNPQISLKSYLYRMAQNAAIDLNRKQKIRMLFAKEVQTAKPCEDSSEEKVYLQIALEKLPDKIRSVFVMHHLQKYTYQEIAELCHVSKKTVEKRMKKAIFLLQKLLGILF